MTDRLTPEHRSWVMSRIRSRDTGPERAVRSLLHAMGYRFTVNGPRNRQLPGRPDIVLPKHRTVVCVHGCFWHRHPGCRLASTPKSNEAFWQTKFATNVTRDRRNQAALAAQGWNVVIVWECETAKPEELAARLDRRIRRVVEYAPPEESDLAVAAEDPPEYHG